MDLLLAAAGMYGICFVIYMVYGWVKDFNREPTPVEITPPKVVYSSQVIHFPDGIVTLTDKEITSPIPDIFTWTPPMQELFLLIVKDWRNWEKLKDKHSFRDIRKHTPTGITLYFKGVTFGAIDNLYETSLKLTSKETSRVVALANVWKEVYYGDKLRRINNIHNIRQHILANESRQKEAQQIRDYLKENGL